MGFNVAGMLLTGLILFVTLRGERGGGFPAFVAGLFGFFLASTGAGGPVSHAIHAFVTALGNSVH